MNLYLIIKFKHNFKQQCLNLTIYGSVDKKDLAAIGNFLLQIGKKSIKIPFGIGPFFSPWDTRKKIPECI